MQNNRKKNSKRYDALTVVAAVMLFATLITGRAVSGTMAKYVSSKPTGDKARVASFSVAASDDGSTSSLSLKHGETKTYTITLDNNSEVSVSGKVSIDFGSSVFGSRVSDYLVVKLDGEDPTEVSGGKITWENASSLTPGQTGEELTLTVTTASALPAQLSGATDKSYSVSFPFTATVTFVQID